MRVQKIDNQTYFNQNSTPSIDNPPIVVAWNFLSAENLGALLRVCDNFGVKQAFFVNQEQSFRLSKIKKTAITAYNKVDWQFVSEEEFWNLIPQNIFKIAVDTTSKSVSLTAFDFKKLSNPCCLFFGNERVGLNDEVISNCDTSIHIPMFGNSYSMNVVQSAAVVLFEAARQRLL